jgi:signal transduction histidine kinase
MRANDVAPYGSLVGVPLLRGEEAVGALAVFRTSKVPYTAKQIALLDTFARQAVIAIENARLIDEIRQKTRQLEAANPHNRQFLSTMSHELRTPLNAIIGYSEILAEDARDGGHDEMLPDLKRINASGRHLLSAIDNVLDLNKIEAGKMELDLSEFAVRELLAEIEAVVPPLMSRNQNRFVLDAPSALGALRSDRTKLRQCLLNLLSNAAKFTEQGTITLAVRSEADRLSFAMTDTGIGMTEQQTGKLFQSFTQAEAGTSSRYDGTGLGLTLSWEFARLMGGDITAESQQGIGSTFILWVPAGLGDGLAA